MRADHGMPIHPISRSLRGLVAIDTSTIDVWRKEMDIAPVKGKAHRPAPPGRLMDLLINNGSIKVKNTLTLRLF
jgi:hypothetical protein